MAFTKRTTDLVMAILLTNSITFSLVTVASKRVLEVPSDAQFGLLTSAPVVFWMGLSLAALAVALSVRRSRPVFLAATSTLFLIWTGLPAMILDYPYRLDANRVSAIASNLLQSGFIDFSRVGPSYLQFPGFFVLAVQTSAVSGLSSPEPANWSTFLWAAIFIIAFGLLVERILGSKPPARVAILVGSFGTVWLQLHFAPQAASIGVTMLVIWVLLSPGVARTASAIL